MDSRDMFGFLLLPLFKRALDLGDAKVQEEALKKLNAFSGHLDFHPLKDEVLPQLHSLALTTVSGKVRINSLVLMGALIERVDQIEAEKMLNTTMQVDQWYCGILLPFVKCASTGCPVFVQCVCLNTFSSFHKQESKPGKP